MSFCASLLINVVILVCIFTITSSVTPPPPPVPNSENHKLHLLADQDDASAKKKKNKKVWFDNTSVFEILTNKIARYINLVTLVLKMTNGKMTNDHKM